MGLTSVELLQPADFPTLKKHGLICAMVSNPTVKGPDGKSLGGIERAWNRTEHHDLLVTAYESQITAVADAGFRNLICFSGNREGLDDETGLKNCAEGLKTNPSAGGKARRRHLAWNCSTAASITAITCATRHRGASSSCKQIGSPHFKLLYDIYHMQIMEGDVIATIRKNQQFIRPLPHRRRSRPPRNRRDAGTQLPRHHARDRRDRLQGPRRPGIHPGPTRPARVPQTGRRDL